MVNESVHRLIVIKMSNNVLMLKKKNRILSSNFFLS